MLDNRIKGIETRHYGESGLSNEDFDDYSASHDINSTYTDTDSEVEKAVVDRGFTPDIIHDFLFRQYYQQIAEGIGKDWSPYRRAGFTLQTLNKQGVIEWPACKQKSPSIVRELSPQSAQTEPRTSTANGGNGNDLLTLFGYRRLTKKEIKDNLIVTAAIGGIVLLAIAGVIVGVLSNSPETGAGIGAVSVAAFCAAASRLAGRWHHRFPLRYRLIRLLTCLALIFSTAAWQAAKAHGRCFADS